MKNKENQFTDAIHQTIYLSKLENDFVSTAYFYRLHDIYQSSTVYMNFPSNHTKRYDHSLGTMQIASEMLSNAINNASCETQNELFIYLDNYFKEVIDRLSDPSKHQSVKYIPFDDERFYMNIIFKKGKAPSEIRKVRKIITDCFIRDDVPIFSESALNGFPFSPTKLIDYSKRKLNKEKKNIQHIKNKADNVEEDIDSLIEFFKQIKNGLSSIEKNIEKFNVEYNNSEFLNIKISKSEEYFTEEYLVFLYKVLLEAVRIVALFHDIGHPPFSHVIENELISIYKNDKYKKPQFKQELVDDFKESITKFLKNDQPLYSRTLLVDKRNNNFAFHESIGFSFLISAIEEVIKPHILSQLKNIEYRREQSIPSILYYILVAEFSLAIMNDENNFFKSMHKIIDGVVDADRLDYCVRDTMTSGLQFGQVDLNRLIKKVKFVSLKENSEFSDCFVLAFPEKVQLDIMDLLEIRYKIFSRINLHHNSIVSAANLQQSVRILIEDYFINGSKLCINSDIKGLWEYIQPGPGIRSLHVINWNDSWLTSTLNESLKRIRYNPRCLKKFLPESLEVVVLGKETYNPLFKKYYELEEFVDAILKDCKNKKNLEKVYKECSKKLGEKSKKISSKNQELYDAINELFENKSLLSFYNLPVIKSYFDNKDFTKHFLTVFHERIPSVKNVIIYPNSIRSKLGLPKNKDIFDKIYLWSNDKIKIMDMTMTETMLKTMEKLVPEFYVYTLFDYTNNYKNKFIEKQVVLKKFQKEISKELNELMVFLISSLKSQINDLNESDKEDSSDDLDDSKENIKEKTK